MAAQNIDVTIVVRFQDTDGLADGLGILLENARAYGEVISSNVSIED